MSKTITLTLSPEGIDQAIAEYKTWRQEFEAKCKEFLQALAEEGVQIASANFSTAVYDGTNDVTVEMQEKGDNTVAVVAIGNATLFIEFGSGILYPDTHPEAGSLGMIRGEYGYGLGGNIWGWTYRGDPGTNGQVISQGWQRGKIHTFGNPANMCMYRTKEELENRFTAIARRIFT